jgi:putative ABC transport system permease protein
MAQAIGSTPDPQQLDPAKLAVLFVLAMTVLIAASLNASSLTMSRMLEVAPVIAVRRAFGASRSQVMRSALSGGMAVFATAALAGCAMAAALSGAFGSAMGRPVDRFPDAGSFALFAAVALLIGFATALYPAISASRFKTSSVLASRWANIPGASVIRVILVAAQVGASAAIIVYAAVVYQQLSFLTEADLGFDRARVVAYKLPEPIAAEDPRSSTLRGLGGSADQSISLSAVLPSEGSLRRMQVQTADGPVIEASAASIDGGYFKVLGAAPVAGRFFEARDLDLMSQAPGPPRPAIISANLAAALGFDGPPAAVGQILRLPGKSEARLIVGVAADMPVGAIRGERRPFALYEPASRPATFLLATSEEIAPRLSQMFADQPIEAISISERVRSAYVDLGRVRWLAGLFAILALVTASVGIYALAVNRAAAMRIEASVRKAFGAESGSIVFLLTKRLAPAILVGVATGLAVGATLAIGWLNGFARQEASVLLAGLIAIAAVATVFIVVSAGQALKLARSKPVDTLRE